MDERPLIELKGIVIAAGWGTDGNVSVVDIKGYDERRYRIAYDPKGRQLHRLVKLSVVVHGRLSPENKQSIIHVERSRADPGEPVTDAFE